MKKLIVLLMFFIGYIPSYAMESEYKIIGKNKVSLYKFQGHVSSTKLKNGHIVYSQENSYIIDNYDKKSNVDSGFILNGFGVSALKLNFKIINDTVLQFYNISYCCDTEHGEKMLYPNYTNFNVWSEKIGDEKHERNIQLEDFIIKLNIKATLKNGYELHLTISEEDRKILDKTKIFKRGYLSDVMYLYNTKYVSIN